VATATDHAEVDARFAKACRNTVARSVASDDEAVAVVLDLVHPVGPGRRLDGASGVARGDVTVGTRPCRPDSNGQTAAGRKACRLRVMDRPVPDYPGDVTGYLVVNDFGEFGKAYVETDTPKRTARRLSAISSPGSTATLSASSPSTPPRAGRATCRRTSRTRCWSALSMPTTISPRTRSASSIGTSPRARNGPRRPRCGAEKIRPSARKPELRIDFGRPWPDSGGHGNSHAWTRHQGRCQRSARRWSPASPGSMCSVPAAAPARRSICGRSIATRWPLSAPLCSACGARGARALRRCPKLTGLFALPPAQRGPVRSARLARGRGSGVV
jgi:hypothetical protein